MRLRSVFAAAVAVCLMAPAAAAEAVNLLADYVSADWKGDSLALDSASGAVYFDSGDGSLQSAVLEMTAEGTGIFFSVDAGNGANTGDSGYCTLEFCGEEGKVLSSVSTGSIKGLENYSRFYIGSEGSYYPLPDGTEKIVISLYAESKGNSGKVNVYFRNFMLFISSEKPLKTPEDTAFMSSITGLTRVEAGLDPWVRWIWIGAVFAVALVFYFVRMMRDKYKTAEIMKAGKKKN